MTEYWERSRVTGTKKGEGGQGYTTTQTVLHRRGADPVVMACRRDQQMACCERISVDTEESFQVERHGLPVRRAKDEIPHGMKQTELLDW